MLCVRFLQVWFYSLLFLSSSQTISLDLLLCFLQGSYFATQTLVTVEFVLQTQLTFLASVKMAGMDRNVDGVREVRCCKNV